MSDRFVKTFEQSLARTLVYAILTLVVFAISKDINTRFLYIILASIFFSAWISSDWRLCKYHLLLFLMFADDSLTFGISDLNFRIWYLLIPFFIQDCLNIRKVNLESAVFLFGWVYVLAFSVISGGELDWIKYSIYILAGIILYQEGRKIGPIFFQATLPVLSGPVLIGLGQILFALFDLNSSIRESSRATALFSESTWLAAYCVLYLFIIDAGWRLKNIRTKYFLCLFVATLTVTLVSKSLNGYIGLIFYAAWFISQAGKNKLLLAFSFLVISLLVFDLFIFDRISALTLDLSLQGRIEGFSVMVQQVLEAGIFGNGLAFDAETYTLKISGIVTGPKGFCFPLQLLYVGGGFLLGPCLYLFYSSMRNFYNSKAYYCTWMLGAWTFMSCFSPVAQGVITPILLACCFLLLAEKKRQLLNVSTL